MFPPFGKKPHREDGRDDEKGDPEMAPTQPRGETDPGETPTHRGGGAQIIGTLDIGTQRGNREK